MSPPSLTRTCLPLRTSANRNNGKSWRDSTAYSPYRARQARRRHGGTNDPVLDDHRETTSLCLSQIAHDKRVSGGRSLFRSLELLGMPTSHDLGRCGCVTVPQVLDPHRDKVELVIARLARRVTVDEQDAVTKEDLLNRLDQSYQPGVPTYGEDIFMERDQD